MFFFLVSWWLCSCMWPHNGRFEVRFRGACAQFAFPKKVPSFLYDAPVVLRKSAKNAITNKHYVVSYTGM